MNLHTKETLEKSPALVFFCSLHKMSANGKKYAMRIVAKGRTCYNVIEQNVRKRKKYAMR